MPPPDSGDRASWWRGFEAISEATISVVIGIFGGYSADRWLETEPVLTLLGLFIGGAAGVRRLLRLPGLHPPDQDPAKSRASGLHSADGSPDGQAQGPALEQTPSGSEREHDPNDPEDSAGPHGPGGRSSGS